MMGADEAMQMSGYHSGFAGISHVLNSLNISITHPQGNKLLSLVRETALTGKKAVSPVELVELYTRV